MAQNCLFVLADKPFDLRIDEILDAIQFSPMHFLPVQRNAVFTYCNECEIDYNISWHL